MQDKHIYVHHLNANQSVSPRKNNESRQHSSPRRIRALIMAIEQSSEEEVKDMLGIMIQKSKDANKIAQKRLLIIDSDSEGSDQDDQEDEEEREQNGEHSLNCRHCENDFNPKTNTDAACSWHSGTRMVNSDSDTWDDWLDKNDGCEDGFIDEYPEGFMWSCCEAPGTDMKGCKSGKHKASVKKRKRTH